LHGLAVHPGLDVNARGINRRNPWAEGSKGIKALGPGPLSISLLQIASSNIVKAGVSQDMTFRLICRDIPAPLSYHHR
jgi:hypothetical protein